MADSFKFFASGANPWRKPMDDTKDEQASCLMHENDEAGNPNLCCCYLIDEDGNIDDPCFHPAEACC
jgi:hypothetical protein